MKWLQFVGLWLFFTWIAHQPRGHILIGMLYEILYGHSQSWHKSQNRTIPLWLERTEMTIEWLTFMLAGVVAFYATWFLR